MCTTTNFGVAAQIKQHRRQRFAEDPGYYFVNSQSHLEYLATMQRRDLYSVTWASQYSETLVTARWGCCETHQAAGMPHNRAWAQPIAAGNA